MHAWQICHLAMVVPIADAYDEADDPKNAGKDSVLMRKTAQSIRSQPESRCPPRRTDHAEKAEAVSRFAGGHDKCRAWHYL
jgi:ketopantoate reductase (EC 1.1.1.169)